MKMQQLMKATLLLVVTMVALTTLLSPNGRATIERVSYSDFLADVRAGSISEVILSGNEIRGERADGEVFSTYAPDDAGLIGDLLESEARVTATPPSQPSLLGQLFLSAFPILLLIGVWVYFMRRQLGGNTGGPLGLGKSKARQFEGGTVNVRLRDVAGVDEAKEEVGELVEFLRDPSRYRKLGGIIPRGVLMVGPPGTGKTLIARAIAGEAGVPFFTVSGSDFVEMFVGVGASRVRDLFAQAKRSAPCIIFVDEIDAVGRRRGAGLGGGHDEREQTLNQMLVEMDGFEGNEGVIVMAATNRPDVLDPALLRPGRFDRQVVVQLPDLNGRAQILELYMRKLPHVVDVDPTIIARGTPGFSGADLANLVNEAALLAARSGSEDVNMEAFERAKDKILMGPERRNLAMSDDERRLTAYHEAGHAIVGRLVPEHDPVHKVTILPRGRALGVTLFLPEQDRYSASKRRLESQIASLFGGRVAEEIVFGADSVTTGAQNDIERATRLARDMVTRWGLSDSLGPVALEEGGDEVFLGRSVTQSKGLSESTAACIDAEVRGIIGRNYDRARALLLANRETLDRMAEALVSHETLDAEQIDRLMRGETLGSGVAEAGGRDEGPTPDLKRPGPAAAAPTAYGQPAEQN